MATIHYIELIPLHSTSSHSDDGSDYLCKVGLRGNLGMDNAMETTALLDALVKGGFRKVALNLENLNYVDSTGIGVIIRLKKSLAASGGDVALLNVPPKIAEVLDLVNIKEYIQIFYTEQKAMDFLRQAGCN
ncbi:MAG TPA: STAS domain-containing protein [Spirochaetales bacterium]|nr:STAS domain-containing protein [Spirochaetales bacterium]